MAESNAVNPKNVFAQIHTNRNKDGLRVTNPSLQAELFEVTIYKTCRPDTRTIPEDSASVAPFTLFRIVQSVTADDRCA